MFHQITWANYFLTIVLFLIIYYGFIAVKFYSNELRELAEGKVEVPFRFAINNKTHETGTAPLLQQSQPGLFDDLSRSTALMQQTDDMFQEVGALVGHLKTVISEAAQKQLIQQEFIFSLQNVLKKYHFLKGTPMLVSVNNLIASECEKHGYHHLSAEERVVLWNE